MPSPLSLLLDMSGFLVETANIENKKQRKGVRTKRPCTPTYTARRDSGLTPRIYAHQRGLFGLAGDKAARV